MSAPTVHRVFVVKKETSAVVLFVKDEAHDIIAWLSWHISLGFDRIFVYDDQSSDGTFDIAKSCAEIYGVEVFRTSAIPGSYHDRKQNSYFDAIGKARGRYDWITMLDSDEYVSIDGSDDINAFLGNFSETDTAIALNWCIYGSSEKILKDRVPTYQAFTYRSKADFEDNTLVKSFVRPEAVDPAVKSSHRFGLSYGNYVDALGRPVEWTSEETKAVVWEKARINHYICRSREHFVEWFRNRPDPETAQGPDYWSHFDRNDSHAPQDPDRVTAANAVCANIKKAVFHASMHDFLVRGNSLERGRNPVLPTRKTEFFHLKNFRGDDLSVDRIDGYLSQGEGSEQVLAAIPYAGNRIWIFRDPSLVSSNIHFHIKNSSCHTYCYDLEFESNATDASIFIKSPKTGKYLTSPSEGSRLEFTTDGAEDQRKFHFSEKVSDTTFHGENEYSEADMVYYILNSGGSFSYEEFILKFANLNRAEMENLRNLFGQQIRAIL